ncbi:Protein CBG24460, partial [Caenorhabditis briggsae]
MDYIYQVQACYNGTRYSHLMVNLIAKTLQILCRRGSSFLALYIATIRALSVLFPMNNIISAMTQIKAGVLVMFLVSVASGSWSLVYFVKSKFVVVQNCDSEMVDYFSFTGPVVKLLRPSYLPYRLVDRETWELTYLMVDGFVAIFISICYFLVVIALVIGIRRANKIRKNVSKEEHDNNKEIAYTDEYCNESIYHQISTQCTMLVSSKDMVFSSENVKQLVKRCIPNELIPVDWKCDQSDIRSNLESLLECSRGQLGMFESVTALFQALANFLTVPGCVTMLQFDGIYATLPLIHTSIKGVEYIYKMDVLELISLAVPCPFEGWQAELVRLAVKSRLKCFEADWKSRFNSNCEMIKVDLAKLKTFAVNLHECAKALFKNTELCMPNLPDFSNVESTDGSYEMLKSFDEKYPIAKNKQFYTQMFS